MDTSEAIESLLSRAKAAHGVYEATELGGVYDDAWPAWYARYAVDHGIGDLLGRPVGVPELARFLASSWQDSQGAGSGEAESWSEQTARRITAEFTG